jgi:ligand-binding sensor domain-containing protein
MLPNNRLVNNNRVVVTSLMAILLLAGCGTSAPAPAGTSSPRPTPTTAPAQTSWPMPSPSALPPTVEPTEPPAGGQILHLGVNQVLDLAFGAAPQDNTRPGSGQAGTTLWAATNGGVAHWNLATDTYVQYTVADGLASNYVTGVAVAPDGSVWFATGSGVSRCDGSTWTTYTVEDGLAAGTPQSIAVAPGGEVWVGTTDGVSRYLPTDGTWASYLSGVRAWDVAIDEHNTVWFASHGAGIIRYSPLDETWTTFTEAAGQPLQGITALGIGPDGEVWAYENWEGVYRFDGTRWQKAWDHSALVCDIALTDDNVPWLGTCGSLHSTFGRLFRGAEGHWIEIEGWHAAGNPAIRALAIGPALPSGTDPSQISALLAAGTDLGIAVRQDGAWRTLRGGPALNQVTAVAVTPDGSVWFGFGTDSPGSAGGGVARFDLSASSNADGGAWHYSLDDTHVRVLAVAPDGALWAGVGCGVQRLDASALGDAAGGPAGEAWQEVAACGDLGVGNVLDFAFGPDGAVWVATGMSLARWHEDGWQVFDKLIQSVAVAPSGTVWASGWEGTQGSSFVARYDGSEWTTALGDAPGSLVVTPDGTVWSVRGERGLVRLAGEAWERVAGPDGQPIRGSLTVAPDGALWVSGPQALARLDGRRWAVYPAVEGTRAMAVAPAPLGRASGTVWLGTNSGVVEFDPEGF